MQSFVIVSVPGRRHDSRSCPAEAVEDSVHGGVEAGRAEVPEESVTAATEAVETVEAAADALEGPGRGAVQFREGESAGRFVRGGMVAVPAAVAGRPVHGHAGGSAMKKGPLLSECQTKIYI